MEQDAGTPATLPRHLYSLDALRGVAALGVVFWHWQHFFFNGVRYGQFVPDRQPLHGLFAPFYLDGARAVDLFFCLSGFVFFWLYARPIRQGDISAGEFAALRFSRLYPLHFVTLLFVAAGQALMMKLHGMFFVYPCNDAYHFVLQLFLASNWGFQDGYSFNYPIWSVSIEVLCYAVFFVVCRARADGWWQLMTFVIAGIVLRYAGNRSLASGVMGFFMGGLMFLTFGALVRRGRAGTSTVPLLTVLTLLGWGFIPYNIHHDIIHAYYRESIWNPTLDLNGLDPLGFVLAELSARGFELVVFPLTILTLALWEARLGTFSRRLSILGQLSYSTYLWHFPLQMLFAGVAFGLGLPKAVFYAPWVLLAFFAILIPLSIASYRYIELPCQNWLRAKLVKREDSAQGQAVRSFVKV